LVMAPPEKAGATQFCNRTRRFSFAPRPRRSAKLGGPGRGFYGPRARGLGYDKPLFLIARVSDFAAAVDRLR